MSKEWQEAHRAATATIRIAIDLIPNVSRREAVREMLQEVEAKARAAISAQPAPGAGVWISVSERLPECGVRVLILFEKSEHIEDATFQSADDGEGWVYTLFDGEYLNDKPTHWQRLPVPPAAHSAGKGE